VVCLPFCPTIVLKLTLFPQILPRTLGRHEGEGGFNIGKGAGQWGGQATIMMCGCDGAWNGGDGSLKRVFKRIQAINHRFWPNLW
jgi:hypothetical protein